MLQESLRTYYASSAFEVSVGARGPQTDGEWLQYNWPQKITREIRGMTQRIALGRSFGQTFAMTRPNILGNLNGDKLETLLTEWRRIGDLAQALLHVQRPAKNFGDQRALCTPLLVDFRVCHPGWGQHV